MAKAVTSKTQDAAQKLAWGVGVGGLKRSPTAVVKAAAAALDGHPDAPSRDRIVAEIARRDVAVSALRKALLTPVS